MARDFVQLPRDGGSGGEPVTPAAERFWRARPKPFLKQDPSPRYSWLCRWLRSWLRAAGCVQLAVRSWLCAVGCVQLAVCSSLCAARCVQLAVCSSLYAAGCMQLAEQRAVQLATKNFGELVISCMDSYDSEQSRTLQHFSNSTRLPDFCTAYISNFSDFRTFW